MALLQRKLDITFSLNADGKSTTNQSFADSGGANSVKLSGLWATAKIEKAGGPSDCTLSLTVYGMTKSQMNQLSTLGMQINLVPKNAVTVEAGDSESGMTTVFQGYILAAYADFSGQPSVAFRVTAHAGLPQSVITAQPTSIKGSADVVTIMSGLATKMGLAFENSGVTGKLASPYYSGSYREQAQKCADDAQISMVIDLNKLAIWPKNGVRGGQAPIVKPPEMKGYPTYTAYGLMIETLFNPSIGFGGPIIVQSDLQPANGTWSVYNLSHDLSTMPGGPWFSTILAYNPKFPAPVLNNG